MKNAKRGVERIKKVLLQDRTGTQENIIAVMKSDVYEVMDAFFEVEPQSVSAEVTVDDRGLYEIRISAYAFRVRGAEQRRSV